MSASDNMLNDWLTTSVLASNWFVRDCAVCIIWVWASSLLHDDDEVGVCACDEVDDDDEEESIKLLEIVTWEETGVEGCCLKLEFVEFELKPDDLEFIFCSTSLRINSLTRVGAASTNWDRISMAIVFTFSSLMPFGNSSFIWVQTQQQQQKNAI